MEKHFYDTLRKYGVVGLMLAYFLYQDSHNRDLDRQDRRNNIKIMETITEKVTDLNTRVTVIEVKLEKLKQSTK
jgi:hypothetical protein